VNARSPNFFSYLSPIRRRRPLRRVRGFTLIELLSVIAVIGILATILIPTVSSARVAAKKARTRAQFAQWASAIEAFRQEYGYYPAFDTTNKVNGTTAAATTGTALHRFYDTLVGARRDGSALPAVTAGTQPNPAPPEAQNTRRIPFISFTESELVSFTTTDAALLAKRGLIRDAFDNTDIAVLVDGNLDGTIRNDGTDFRGALPTVSPPDNSTIRIAGPSAADFPTGRTGGVRAGVIFYCAPEKATSQADLLMSWK